MNQQQHQVRREHATLPSHVPAGLTRLIARALAASGTVALEPHLFTEPLLHLRLAVAMRIDVDAHETRGVLVLSLAERNHAHGQCLAAAVLDRRGKGWGDR